MCVSLVKCNNLSCVTTFVNDSGNNIGILNNNDEKFIVIPKKGKRRFGNHHQYASFKVYIPAPKAKFQVFTPKYECKQKACGTDGNIILKFSDIENNSGETACFTIIKRKPRASMVHELPMIHKKNISHAQ